MFLDSWQALNRSQFHYLHLTFECSHVQFESVLTWQVRLEHILAEQLHWHAFAFCLHDILITLAVLPTSSSLATSKPCRAHSDAEGGPLNLLRA